MGHVTEYVARFPGSDRLAEVGIVPRVVVNSDRGESTNDANDYFTIEYSELPMRQLLHLMVRAIRGQAPGAAVHLLRQFNFAEI